jgi:hypothetical protein
MWVSKKFFEDLLAFFLLFGGFFFFGFTSLDIFFRELQLVGVRIVRVLRFFPKLTDSFCDSVDVEVDVLCIDKTFQGSWTTNFRTVIAQCTPLAQADSGNTMAQSYRMAVLSSKCLGGPSYRTPISGVPEGMTDSETDIIGLRIVTGARMIPPDYICCMFPLCNHNFPGFPREHCFYSRREQNRLPIDLCDFWFHR